MKQQKQQEQDNSKVDNPALAEERICEPCEEQNLVRDVHVRACVKCCLPYCVHFASSIDPCYCVHCHNDINVTIENIVKTEFIERQNGEVIAKRRRAKLIKIGGMDWLFAQRRISKMQEPELLAAIEYHRALYDELILERETRRIEHFRRNAGKTFKVTTVNTNAVEVTETTTVKKSKVTKVLKPKADTINVGSMMEQFLKAGLSKEDILKMLLKK